MLPALGPPAPGFVQTNRIVSPVVMVAEPVFRTVVAGDGLAVREGLPLAVEAPECSVADEVDDESMAQ